MRQVIRTSIRYKLIILLLISIVIPIGTSIIITYVYTTESLKDRTLNENTRLISEVRNNIATFLDTLNSASLAPYSNVSMDSILTQGLSDIQSESYIYAALQLVSRAVKEVQKVYLYANETERSYLFYEDNFTQEIGKSPLILPKNILPYAGYAESTHISNSYGMHPMTPVKHELVFSIIRPLYRVPSSVQIGLISIDVKLDALRRLVSQLYNKGSEDIYILDGAGSVVYASDELLIGTSPNEPWFRKILDNSDGSGSLEVKNEKFSGIMIYSKINSSILKWTVIKRISDNYIYGQARKLTLINTVITGILLIVAIFFILFVTIMITDRIKELTRYMNKIKAGQLEVPIHIEGEDEIGILARHFRMMMHTINDLVLREYKLDLANKTNQLNMLQAQINPHFINNSLQSIGNLALESNAPKVYSLISSLGQMMHYSMNTKETIVPLDKEIDHLTYYLMLQQQRFEDKLTFDLDIDKATGSISVPKMILQPIVENFIKHGFHPESRIGNIKVKTHSQNGKLILVVEDNGQGISEEQLHKIRMDLSETQKVTMELGENIGLMNVLFRLRLYYGEQVEMEISALDPYGLRVMLILPLINLNS